MKERLAHLFERRFGHAPEAILDVAADGSDRRIYRLLARDGMNVIGVIGSDHEENSAFLSFSRALRAIELPVPEIYAADEDAGVYLEEDLGDTTLFDALTAARVDAEFPSSIVPIYHRVVELLPRIQVEGGRVIDYSVAYPHEAFDRQSIAWDLNYFKYHFLKPAKIKFNESRLERDFTAFSDFLMQADVAHFLYRDFQSRNIMIRDGEPWFIDYQGGRRGAVQYDIASLLYDAKADIPETLREELLSHYIESLSNYLNVDRNRFLEHYRGYVLVRIMQAMGAYGYRGIFERKTHFLASIPYAIDNIRSILASGPLPVEMPELRGALERIVESEWAGRKDGGRRTEDGGEGEREKGRKGEGEKGREEIGGSEGVRVYVRSFSYKRGYPVDEGGHGGGFVFDCRSLPNPGRYAEYADRTGRDADVVEFLERETSVEGFWRGVEGLIDNAVRTYIARGFTSLSVAFGCTGGQHRSVYFAERLARHLMATFPDIVIDLEHRESSRWPGRNVDDPQINATVR